MEFIEKQEQVIKRALSQIIDEVEEQANKSFTISYGLFTDIGGGNENQDMVKTIAIESENVLVHMCADGHGKQFGKFFAKETIKFMEAYILENLKHEFISISTEYKKIFFENMFIENQEYLRKSIIQNLISQGYIVDESNGYPIFTSNHSDWSLVLGGTSFFLIIFRSLGKNL